MGEKIKTLGTVNIKNSVFEIELNKPSASGLQRQIHIQSKDSRFEMDEGDFLRFAISILVAEKNLKNTKGIK
jgi:hypothetical protein